MRATPPVPAPTGPIGFAGSVSVEASKGGMSQRLLTVEALWLHNKKAVKTRFAGDRGLPGRRGTDRGGRRGVGARSGAGA